MLPFTLNISLMLSIFLVFEPASCISASSIIRGSDGLLGLEELPFANAERAADWEHLAKIEAKLKLVGNDSGAFPTSEQSLAAAIGNAAFENSPYFTVQAGWETTAI